MKKLLFIFTLYSMALLAISCKNKVDIKSITTGKWYIADFKENGIHKKQRYKGCTFQFFTNHKICAVLNHFTYYGTWNVSSDYPTDDEPVDDNYLSLTFNKDITLASINGDYVLLNCTSDSLVLNNENLSPNNLTLMMVKIK